jgi:hypothetical protein
MYLVKKIVLCSQSTRQEKESYYRKTFKSRYVKIRVRRDGILPPPAFQKRYFQKEVTIGRHSNPGTPHMNSRNAWQKKEKKIEQKNKHWLWDMKRRTSNSRNNKRKTGQRAFSLSLSLSLSLARARALLSPPVSDVERCERSDSIRDSERCARSVLYYIYIYLHINTYTYIHVCVCVCVCVCVVFVFCVCFHKDPRHSERWAISAWLKDRQIQTQTQTLTHTHAHAHTHTLLDMSRAVWHLVLGFPWRLGSCSGAARAWNRGVWASPGDKSSAARGGQLPLPSLSTTSSTPFVLNR